MRYTMALLLVLSLSFISCGSDDVSDYTVQTFNQTINSEITALNMAIDIFNADQSEANCDNLKEAAQGYLDAIKDLAGCPEISQSDYDLALDDAQDAVDMLTC